MTDYTDENGNPVAAPIEMTYDTKRLLEYPQLTEQFDMLWHELNANGSLSTNGEWFTTIQDIKNRHPKSSDN